MFKYVIIVFAMVATLSSSTSETSALENVIKVKAWMAKLDEPPIEASVDCLLQQDCSLKFGDEFEVNFSYQRDRLYTVSTIAYGLPTDGPDCCSFYGDRRESFLDTRNSLAFYDLFFHRSEDLSLRKAKKIGKLYISIEK